MRPEIWQAQDWLTNAPRNYRPKFTAYPSNSFVALAWIPTMRWADLIWNPSWEEGQNMSIHCKQDLFV